MEILRVTLAAGERKSFHKSGRYFEVMKASAPFDAWFTDRAIGVYPCLGLEAGVFSEMPFQYLELQSATDQTITLMVSDFRAGYRSSLKDEDMVSMSGKAAVISGVVTAGAGVWGLCAIKAQPSKIVAIEKIEINCTVSGAYRVFVASGAGTAWSALQTKVQNTINKSPYTNYTPAVITGTQLSAAMPTAAEMADQSTASDNYTALPYKTTELTTPIVLNENKSIAFVTQTANNFLFFRFNVREL